VLPRLDRADWLRNCRRFRVEASDRRLGTVEDVGFGADSEPAVLIVRACLCRRRVGHVHVDQIETIVPEQERIILRRSPRIVWHEEGGREGAAAEEPLQPSASPGAPGGSRPWPLGAPPAHHAGAAARPSAPGGGAAPPFPGVRPAEVALTLEEAKTAIRAAGGDVIQVGFLARAYLRQREEGPESAETAAARERLCELLTTRLRDRQLLALEGRFELLEEPVARKHTA
jgi:hypothetical protein